MWSWQVAVPGFGPCGMPSIIMLHMPQMPSRQSLSNAIGSSPLAMRSSLTTSSISRNDMSGRHVVGLVADHLAFGLGAGLAPNVEDDLHL